jgi:hypothetical protein
MNHFSGQQAKESTTPYLFTIHRASTPRGSPMENDINNKKNLKIIVSTTLIMIVIGVVYALLFGELHVHSIINGIAIGGMIGLLSSLAEVFMFSRFRQRFTLVFFLLCERCSI